MEKRRVIIILGICLLAVSTMAALSADKMKVVAVCRDVRIGMDGGINATIEASRLTIQKSVTVFTQKNGPNVKIGSMEVSAFPFRTTEAIADSYIGAKFNLALSKKETRLPDRIPANIDAELNGKKITATMLCST